MKHTGQVSVASIYRSGTCSLDDGMDAYTGWDLVDTLIQKREDTTPPDGIPWVKYPAGQQLLGGSLIQLPTKVSIV